MDASNAPSDGLAGLPAASRPPRWRVRAIDRRPSLRISALDRTRGLRGGRRPARVCFMPPPAPTSRVDNDSPSPHPATRPLSAARTVGSLLVAFCVRQLTPRADVEGVVDALDDAAVSDRREAPVPSAGDEGAMTSDEDDGASAPGEADPDEDAASEDKQTGDEEEDAKEDEALDVPHPERPDSRDDPDVGEPGADLVEGVAPVPDGVLGMGEVPADRSKPIRPPEAEVRGCKKCPAVKAPEYCGYQPKLKPGSRGLGRRLMSDGGDGGGRGLLASKHTAFQAADRKLAVSRQPDFKPPSEGFRQEIVNAFKEWRNEDKCTMWTRDCVLEWQKNSSRVWGIRKGPEHLFAGRKMPENAHELFPDLQKGSLGSCALVAVADGMLGKKRGPEIDAHDTVFRYNGPMKGYTRDIGTRGDVFYWKQRRNEQQYGVEGQKATLFYMWKDFAKYQWTQQNVGDKKEIPKQVFRGKQNLWESDFAAGLVGKAYSMYAAEDKRDRTKHSSSGGFKLALSVLASGLCTRVDMYGYSSYGGGRYFKNAVVNLVHKIGLEHYVLRTAMEEKFGVCMYD